MPTDLYQGWDHRWLGTATIDFTDDSGPHTASITTGRYAHLDFTAVDPKDRRGVTINTGFDDFATALQTAMDAATAQTVTVSWSATNGQYTIACTGAVFTLTFTGAPGATMRRIIGMHADRTGATSYVSSMRPWYFVRAAIDGRTAYDQATVKDDQIRASMSADGTLYTLAPTRLITAARWEHHFEAKARVHSRFADADTLNGGVSWTYEDFLNFAARYSVPCAIRDSVETLVFRTQVPFSRSSVRRRTADADPHQIVVVVADSIVGYA
jgi:hypothetical protein